MNEKLKDAVFFYGGTLSQWFPSKFTVDGQTFCTAEQYMMAMKASVFNDVEIYDKILATNSPFEQKKLGRQIRNFDEKIWDPIKYKIVVKGNLLKFSQNSSLENSLYITGDKLLVEASPWDKIWGIGLGMENPDIYDYSKWQGQNLLGKALMEVRDKLC